MAHTLFKKIVLDREAKKKDTSFFSRTLRVKYYMSNNKVNETNYELENQLWNQYVQLIDISFTITSQLGRAI